MRYIFRIKNKIQGQLSKLGYLKFSEDHFDVFFQICKKYMLLVCGDYLCYIFFKIFQVDNIVKKIENCIMIALWRNILQ